MELYGRSAAKNGSRQNLNASWAPETGLEEPMSRLGLWGRDAYPERPGATNCVYYLRTGSCGYGAKCRYNHPRDPASVGGAVPLRRAEYPERVGEPECQVVLFFCTLCGTIANYYLRTGTCKFGGTCKFHHPRNAGGSLINVPLNISGYPLRVGEKECSYYLKTGLCKFGITCKFHHPQPAGVSTPVTARPFYPTVQSPSAAPEQFNAASSSFRVPRPPPLLTSSYLPGAYGAVLLHTGVVPIPNWSPYTGAINHPFSTGAQAAVGATSLYGVSSTPGVSGSYPPFPSSSIPLESKQKGEQFPERPGQPECQYYMKNGDCKYGSSCKYHHPPDWVVTKTYSFLSPLGLPLRPGMQSCSYYLQKGHCKFGHNCKFDHPMGTLEYSPSASSLNEIPIASYVLSSSATTMVATVSFPELQDEFSPETKLGVAKTKDQSYGNSLSSAVDLVLARNSPFSLSTVQFSSQSSNSSITRNNSREDSEVHHPG